MGDTGDEGTASERGSIYIGFVFFLNHLTVLVNDVDYYDR